jgi:molecular chaperone DnaK
VKARAENLVADARQALAQDTPVERLRTLTAELRQAYQGLAIPEQAGQQDTPGTTSGGGGDDDVIDAEFTPSE